MWSCMYHICRLPLGLTVGEAAAVGWRLIEEDAVDMDVLVVFVGAAGRRPVLVRGNVRSNGGLGLRANANCLTVATAGGRCGSMDISKSADVGDRVELGNGVDVVGVVTIRAGRGAWA